MAAQLRVVLELLLEIMVLFLKRFDLVLHDCVRFGQTILYLVQLVLVLVSHSIELLIVPNPLLLQLLAHQFEFLGQLSDLKILLHFSLLIFVQFLL